MGRHGPLLAMKKADARSSFLLPLDTHHQYDELKRQKSKIKNLTDFAFFFFCWIAAFKIKFLVFSRNGIWNLVLQLLDFPLQITWMF
jgi:hypothetical protein